MRAGGLGPYWRQSPPNRKDRRVFSVGLQSTAAGLSTKVVALSETCNISIVFLVCASAQIFFLPERKDGEV